MRPLSALPDDILADADALLVLEAAAAWGHADPPEDALTHAVLNDATRGIQALARVRTEGVLDRQGRRGEWFDAIESLLAGDPEGPALMERLCRYEGIVIQGYTMASAKVLHPNLMPRVQGDVTLLQRAVAAGVGLAAADLAGAMAAGSVLAGEVGEQLGWLASQEVEAARSGPSPGRLDEALSNLSTVRELQGDARGALDALRARLTPAPDLNDALRIASIALRAGEDDVAETALERAWGLSFRGSERPEDAGAEDKRAAIALSLAQVRLILGRPSAGVLDAGEFGELAPDRELLLALGLDDEVASADAVHAALGTAIQNGPPTQGRVLDRVIRVVRARRVRPGVLLRLVAHVERARRDAEGAARGRWDGWMVVLGFLVAWTAAPADPRMGILARRADGVTGGHWSFEAWEGLSEA